jgi:hypothetical protein
MKNRLLLIVAVLSLTAALSCGRRSETGGGKTIVETRTFDASGSGASTNESRALSAFTAIETAGSTNVDVYPAASPRVEVSGYENLVKIFVSEVKDGTLHLHFKEGYNIRNSNIHVKVYSPGVRSISQAGSGEIMVHPGATILVEEAKLAGSGNITINQSDAPELSLSIAGSGDIDARSARADVVNAEIAGSGGIKVMPRDRLQASITGSGDVHYWGSAQVEKEIVGSGDVVHH